MGKIERKIRVIKEQVCALIYGIPASSLPAVVTLHIILFVTKLLNMFPVKGGIQGWSPKQIMAGEVIHYKDYSLPVGSYYQISEEGVPRNSMKPRMHGAISLGPSGNSQGGQKFFALDTGKVVVRR